MKIMTLLFMGLGVPEILLIVLAILLLFGAKKIPELMKSMGKGVKNFKEGMNGTDDAAAESEKSTTNPDPEKKAD